MTNQEWFDTSDCDFCSSRSEKTENYSAERPPQHKKANESSQQVGSTSAAVVDDIAASMETKLHVCGGGEAYEDNYTTDHKPPSNISNGTTSTDATAVANSNTTFTTPAYNHTFFTDKGLTESVLAKHQYELQVLSPGDMGTWLEGAGPGCTRLAVGYYYNKKGHGGAARSKPSQASDASYDYVASPTTEAGQNLDVLASGAQFNEQTFNPYMYTSHIDM
ncbi:hypothetical protein GE09DRAFT_1057153 [Coniochaeta sp. 2T2.1]|nr:hypothetical protein GE09DRAFT_1057153 [Coniochaeta sp. 2T2.1]